MVEIQREDLDGIKFAEMHDHGIVMGRPFWPPVVPVMQIVKFDRRELFYGAIDNPTQYLDDALRAPGWALPNEYEPYPNRWYLISTSLRYGTSCLWAVVIPLLNEVNDQLIDWKWLAEWNFESYHGFRVCCGSQPASFWQIVRKEIGIGEDIERTALICMPEKPR